MFFADTFSRFGLSSHFLDIVFCGVKVFNFIEVQLIIFFFMHHAFDVVAKKPMPNPVVI